MTYTVIALRPADGGRFQRWSDSFEAEDVHDAEDLARASVRDDSGDELLVAGVVEGEFLMADNGIYADETPAL